ncbi:flagellar hook-length control protein FliK [Bdellovibrio sp. 22V]|uniref:flagellar hook-length control protein FliK n=1 Tax=Bdellovibrio sp. 22V TaxID=3044166 RepID=UPI002542CDE3|nr:flagellar hook-length control protein FliK [Bdellovibrio sp. 22V]WII72391.1 flagellar hook-length control protein FliK [Bdellovibrio sp. 22V]
MLQSIVGPPMVGATELKSPPERSVERDFKGSGSESSFGKALEEKISSKAPKEMKDTKETPQREMRQNEKEEPQKSEAKKESPVQQQDGKISKKATVRQKAIQEFMDSFESEFKIPPTRLVEAMAQLDETQLAQSPEVTANAVIAQLGLDEEQTDKAQAMYVSLLMQLQQAQPQQPKAVPEMTFGGAGVSLQQVQQRIAAAQQKQNGLEASVDRVNSKFWMRQEPKAMPTAMPALESSLAQRMMMDEGAFASLPQEEMPMEIPADLIPQEEEAQVPAQPQTPMKELPPHLQGQMKEAASPALLAALAAARAQQSSGASAEGEESAELMQEFQQAVQNPRMEKAPMPDQQAPVMQGKAAQDFFQNASQDQSMMQQNSQEFMQQGTGAEKDAAKSKLVTKGAEFKHSLNGLEALQAAPIKGESLKLEGLVPMAPAAPTAPVNQGENDAAVKQLMNQAQYLIKKGGGEMKVQMTPEGMGTIHLKVMLQDGKVNLQMSADTQEAKKTIESSLAELKTSLAAHKLSMENVKVDVVNSTSTDTATQNQTNMNGNQNRDQARQFWNQFNENFGSQGRRESLMDMPNLKGYGARNRDPLQPIETASKARPRNVEGKGNGLNLVA